MSSAKLDLTDRLARFPVSYGRQPVRGTRVKHVNTTVGAEIQKTVQQALAEGPWDACERLYVQGTLLEATEYAFHNGTATDAPDSFFPNEPSHPFTAHYSARLPQGMSDDPTENLFGIFRTLRTANFNAAGEQVNSIGASMGAAGAALLPEHFFYYPNPAIEVADQIIRWGKRASGIINWPAWTSWRDWCDVLIPWDDSKYNPRSLSLTPTTGGSLAAGTYYVRVATVKGADVSGSSVKSIETLANTIVISGVNNAFQVNWLLKDTVTDHTAFRVYVGTAPNVWSGYFTVSDPTLRTLLITTLAGATAGSPPNTATAGLLRQVKRFQGQQFFVPPYDLSASIDRILQISCADYQWAEGKIRFLSPEARTPIFTLNLAEVAPDTFRTFAVDRRQRPNQIIVTYRDEDDEFLNETDPVILDREQLQLDEGRIKTFAIDGGTMLRSQAQRMASYWARVHCDMDQLSAMKASPKSFHVLPADVVKVTNDVPDWEDVEFVVQIKEENTDRALGDQLSLKLYSANLYSDTDHSPLVRPLPPTRTSPFDAPPVISALNLEEVGRILADGTFISTIQGGATFAAFAYDQRGRVWIKRPGASEFSQTGIVVTPSAGTSSAGFEIPSVTIGTHELKVVTESTLGVSLPFAAHPTSTIPILGVPPVPVAPINLVGTRFTRSLGGSDLICTWDDGIRAWSGQVLRGEEIKKYLIEIRDATTNTLVRTETIDKIESQAVKWSGGYNQLYVFNELGSVWTTGTMSGQTTSSQLVSGDSIFEFQTDNRAIPVYIGLIWYRPDPLNYYPIIYSAMRGYMETGRPKLEIPYRTSIGGTTPFTTRFVIPEKRYAVEVRNGHIYFYENGLVIFEEPMTFTRPGESFLAYRFHATLGTMGGEPQAALKCRITPRRLSQYVYTKEMHEQDFLGSQPATVKFRVAQVSYITGTGVFAEITV